MNTVAALPEVVPAGLVELRRCRVDHLDALMTAIESSQTDLARWLRWADPIPTVQAERACVENLEAAFATDDDWGYFLIELHSGELVRGAGLHPFLGSSATRSNGKRWAARSSLQDIPERAGSGCAHARSRDYHVPSARSTRSVILALMLHASSSRQRLGAVADRMICARLRLAISAPTWHYAPR
jgi:hypothetical protein